jgi:hypothetical protein
MALRIMHSILQLCLVVQLSVIMIGFDTLSVVMVNVVLLNVVVPRMLRHVEDGGPPKNVDKL